MAVDLVLPGVPYDCVVRTESGDLVTVGSWTPTSAGGAQLDGHPRSDPR